MSGPDRDLPGDQSAVIAAGVRDALARRRMSRRALADLAKISLSTLEKVLAGRRPFTQATMLRLQEALGVPLLGVSAHEKGDGAGQAPETLGSYSETAALWIEGRYLTLRPSFGAPGAIFAYQTEIVWDPSARHLVFREGERVDADFTHAGVVSLPPESGHVYLVTNQRGQYRLAVLGHPTVKGDMYGLSTTLMAGRGSHLTPVSSSIVLVREAEQAEAWTYGRVKAGDPSYASYKTYLDRVLEGGYAALLPG
ncbi:MAG: helix-turn-helix transcriptional regulator [Beijerinckiaceae bacterium]|jgi:transcriptional regulator with XRE-family HTH domain